MYYLPLTVFTASKGSFHILFFITAAGVVSCGGPKKSLRTSFIVQIIFFFTSFEISKNIQSTQNIYAKRHSLNNNFTIRPHLGNCLWFRLPWCKLSKLQHDCPAFFVGFLGSLTRAHYPNFTLYGLYYLLLNVFNASKGSFHILFFTVAGVKPCGGPKKPPRASSKVQILFFFTSFGIS